MHTALPILAALHCCTPLIFVNTKIMSAAEITTAMLSRLRKDDGKTNKEDAELTSKDVEFLQKQLQAYDNLPTSCQDKTLNGLSFCLQAVLLLFLLLFSGIPTKLGLLRWVGSLSEMQKGQIPSFNHGLEPGFTFEALDRLDLSGQTALVTGGNSGVGFETAKYLVKLGASTTILCRNEERCTAAAQAIESESGSKSSSSGSIATLVVDMSDLKAVRIATKSYAQSIRSLDMLFLNAGIVSAGTDSAGQLKLSVDGIEKVFATNHVGHQLLYSLLESKLLQTKTLAARVVLTSSASSFQSYDYGVATDLETLNGAPVGDMKPYGQSKLAQILFAKELTRRLAEKKEKKILVNAYHPGCAATDIWDKNDLIPSFLHGPVMRFFKKNVMWSQKDGALTMLWLGAAVEDLVAKDVRGKYWHPQAQEVIPQPWAHDVTLQKEVWKFTDALLR